MARRRELADAADGISGHFVFDSPANPDWPLAHVAFAMRAGDGATYSFDLLAGTVNPHSAHVGRLARFLQGDLTRHLAARGIDAEWVSDATLVVTAEGETPGTRVPVRCEVTITDDRGAIYTSTRRGSMSVPRVPFGRRVSVWLRARFTA
jgi:hypothetical protein